MFSTVRRHLLPVLLALLAFSLAAHAQGKLWVVDAGNGPRRDLQVVIDAAADGDTIYVKAGSYGAVSVDGKSLVIGGDGIAAVQLTGIVIRRLGVAQAATVRGVKVAAPLGRPALQLQQNSGSVLLEDCWFAAADGGAACVNIDLPAAEIVDSTVTIARCTFRGGANGRRSDGVRATGSSLHAFDSSFFAADSCVDSLTGGDGLWLAGGFLAANNCAFRGGRGGPATVKRFKSWIWITVCVQDAGDGGAGLHLSGAPAPTARLVNCSLAAGAAGRARYPCAPSSAGRSLQIDSGKVFRLSGVTRRFQARSPVREGQNWTVVVDGAPGDLVFIATHPRHRPWFLPSCAGSFVPGPGVPLIIRVGVLPASGTAQLLLKVPDLGLPDAVAVVSQALIGAGNQCHLTAPSTTLVLDRRF